MIDANGLFPITQLKNEENRSENIKTIRSLAKTSYLGNNLCVCRVLGQYLMFVNTLDERLGIQLQMNGYWEMGITEYMARTIKPGMHVIDIGANYGYFSMLMSTLVGPKGRVYALEANPYLCSLIKKSSKVNGVRTRVKAINKAISDHVSDDVEFIYYEDHPMNGHLTEAKSKQAVENATPQTRTSTNHHTGRTIRQPRPHRLYQNRHPKEKPTNEGSEDKFWYGSQKVREKNPTHDYVDGV